LFACGTNVVTDTDAGEDALKNRLIYGPDFDPNADNSAYTINGEIFTNLQDSNDPGQPNETQQDTEQKSPIEAQQPLNPIVNIVDRTKTEGQPYDMAEEKFFEDGNNEYYFSGIYSHYVIVHYEDGSQEDIVIALNAGRATIADLDKFEVDYIVRALDTENVIP